MTESSTPVVDMIRRLLSRGLSRDDALEEAAIFEATVARTPIGGGAEFDRRKYERDRKAQQRAAKARIVPDIVPEVKLAAIPASNSNIQKLDSKKDSPQLDLSGTIRDTDQPKRPSQGRALPTDWAPDDADAAYAGKLNLTPDEMRSCAEDMRLWARANANRAVGRKADWRSTFYGWMRREAPKIIRQRRPGGNYAANQPGGKRTFAVLAAELRHGTGAAPAPDAGGLEPPDRYRNPA